VVVQMKICVAAPDSKLANLAILKIAQYHLNNGDSVKWYEPLQDQDADRLYVSKIFTFTPTPIYSPNCEVVYGGTGIDVENKLPTEIESITKIEEAYRTLYPNIDYSILFTTRGCVRKCPFCVVPRKEGIIHDVCTTALNPNGKHIKVLDNSFFTSPSWEARLAFLKSLNQPLDFSQGIDVRLITEKQSRGLGECNIKAIHIAWDNIKDEEQIFRGIETLTRYVSPCKLTCYVLVGFEQPEIVESDIYRIMKLHRYKITPFAMGYIDFDNPKHERALSVRRFQRWVNKHIFKTVDFNDYGNRTNEAKEQTTIYDFAEGE